MNVISNGLFFKEIDAVENNETLAKQFVSIWEKPQDYALEMSLFTVAVIIAAVLAVKTPSGQKARLSREELADK